MITEISNLINGFKKRIDKCLKWDKYQKIIQDAAGNIKERESIRHRE